MTIKFKIGFTIGADTLFGLMSKMLPIEDLEVEEIAPKPMLAERAIAIHKLTHKPKPQIRKRVSPGPDLKKGINGVIMVALSDEPKRAIELQPKIAAAGFSENSVTSRLEALRKHGVIERDSDGRWKRRETT
jgi:hypothetical protein